MYLWLGFHRPRQVSSTSEWLSSYHISWSQGSWAQKEDLQIKVIFIQAGFLINENEKKNVIVKEIEFCKA